MIVNINQCASTYDETLYVAKFSAIASQVSKTNELCDMLRIPPASVGTGPFPSRGGEDACTSSLCFYSGLLSPQSLKLLLC